MRLAHAPQHPGLQAVALTANEVALPQGQDANGSLQVGASPLPRTTTCQQRLTALAGCAPGLQRERPERPNDGLSRILAAGQGRLAFGSERNLAQGRGPIHGIRQGRRIPRLQQPGALALQAGLRQCRACLAPQRPADLGLAHRIGLRRQRAVVREPRVNGEQQRHSRALAIKARQGGTVGTPQPDPYGPAAGDPHGPAVPIAVAGARLPGESVDPAGRLAGEGLIRPPLGTQYLPDDPGGPRAQQGAGHRLLPRQPDRHRHLPLPGEGAVERHQLLEPNARRPQRNGRVGLVRERQPHPGVVEPADQLVGPKRLQHLHRRHVEGLLQRLGEGHRPLKGAGKIGGSIVGT